MSASNPGRSSASGRSPRRRTVTPTRRGILRILRRLISPTWSGKSASPAVDVTGIPATGAERQVYEYAERSIPSRCSSMSTTKAGRWAARWFWVTELFSPQGALSADGRTVYFAACGEPNWTRGLTVAKPQRTRSRSTLPPARKARPAPRNEWRSRPNPCRKLQGRLGRRLEGVLPRHPEAHRRSDTGDGNADKAAEA